MTHSAVDLAMNNHHYECAEILKEHGGRNGSRQNTRLKRRGRS